MSSQTELPVLAAELTGRIPAIAAEHEVPGITIVLVRGADTWLAGRDPGRRPALGPVRPAPAAEHGWLEGEYAGRGRRWLAAPEYSGPPRFASIPLDRCAPLTAARA